MKPLAGAKLVALSLISLSALALTVLGLIVIDDGGQWMAGIGILMILTLYVGVVVWAIRTGMITRQSKTWWAAGGLCLLSVPIVYGLARTALYLLTAY